VATRKRCRKCGREKGPGRCRPCRAAYLRGWASRNRAGRAYEARLRYQESPRAREQGRERNYRWRGENRGHYLELKREENRRRRERLRSAAAPPSPDY
jgi:hypothetical protein